MVLLLVLLNAVYFAWSQRMLAAYGYAPAQQAEPERVSRQIRPEALTILSTEQARQVDAAAQSAVGLAQCLQAGPFDETQSAALRQAVQAVLPAGSWTLDEVVRERAQTRTSELRIGPLDDAARARLEELKPALAGRSLRPCN